MNSPKVSITQSQPNNSEIIKLRPEPTVEDFLAHKEKFKAIKKELEDQAKAKRQRDGEPVGDERPPKKLTQTHTKALRVPLKVNDLPDDIICRMSLCRFPCEDAGPPRVIHGGQRALHPPWQVGADTERPRKT